MENAFDLDQFVLSDDPHEDLFRQEFFKLTDGLRLPADSLGLQASGNLIEEPEQESKPDLTTEELIEKFLKEDKWYKLPETDSILPNSDFRHFGSRPNRYDSQLPGYRDPENSVLEPLPFLDYKEQTKERLEGLRTFTLPFGDRKTDLILKRRCGEKSKICLNFQREIN